MELFANYQFYLVRSLSVSVNTFWSLSGAIFHTYPATYFKRHCVYTSIPWSLVISLEAPPPPLIIYREQLQRWIRVSYMIESDCDKWVLRVITANASSCVRLGKTLKLCENRCINVSSPIHILKFRNSKLWQCFVGDGSCYNRGLWLFRGWLYRIILHAYP